MRAWGEDALVPRYPLLTAVVSWATVTVGRRAYPHTYLDYLGFWAPLPWAQEMAPNRPGRPLSRYLPRGNEAT